MNTEKLKTMTKPASAFLKHEWAAVGDQVRSTGTHVLEEVKSSFANRKKAASGARSNHSLLEKFEEWKGVVQEARDSFKIYNWLRGKKSSSFTPLEIIQFLREKVPLYEGRDFDIKEFWKLMKTTWAALEGKGAIKIFVFIKKITMELFSWKGVNTLEEKGVLEKFHLLESVKEKKEKMLGIFLS